jgi:hypothetical protein
MNRSHQTAPTQFVEANGIRFAYRRFGKTCGLSSDDPAKPASELSDRPKFNVVIVYEDRAAGRRAKYFYDNLIHELEDECDFSLELWSFQVLAISTIGHSAVQVAGQADFVILSLHGKAGLPVEIREWIETWSRLISDSNAALIALIDKPRTRGGSAASTLAYLRSVATRTGIDFFAHTAFSPVTN